jgi:hypothetical protein
MSQSWFYQHGGQTQGPVSSEQMKDLAKKQLLDAHDLIWPEGGDPLGAIPADAALDFSSLTTASVPPTAANPTPVSKEPPPAPPALPSGGNVPDWLRDVASLEKTGPTSPALATVPAAPDYLEDLRLWLALEIARPKVPVQAVAPTPTPAKEAVLLVKPVTPAAAGAVPLAKPVARALTRPAAPTPPKAPVQSKTPAAPASATPRTSDADTVAERARLETGFDITTGRILDPEKFKQWRQQRPTGAPAATNGSMLEAFRKGRILVETWIDDDKNRPRITHGDVQEIKKHKEVQAILAQFSQFGSAMSDKLERHLEFMVENRRKYYRATGGK